MPNDKDLWEVSYIIYAPEDADGNKPDPVYVNAILCSEYASKYLSDLPDDQLISLQDEMNSISSTSENYLCPDVESF